MLNFSLLCVGDFDSAISFLCKKSKFAYEVLLTKYNIASALSNLCDKKCDFNFIKLIHYGSKRKAVQVSKSVQASK